MPGSWQLVFVRPHGTKVSRGWKRDSVSFAKSSSLLGKDDAWLEDIFHFMGSFYKRTFHRYHSWAQFEISNMILDWLSSSNKTQVYLGNRPLLEKLKGHCSDKKKSHQVLPQDYQLWLISAWTSAVSSAGAPYPLRHPTEEHTSSSLQSLNTSLDICKFATLFSLNVFEGGEKKTKEKVPAVSKAKLFLEYHSEEISTFLSSGWMRWKFRWCEMFVCLVCLCKVIPSL